MSNRSRKFVSAASLQRVDTSNNERCSVVPGCIVHAFEEMVVLGRLMQHSALHLLLICGWMIRVT
jgi:hypothetical protein